MNVLLAVALMILVVGVRGVPHQHAVRANDGTMRIVSEFRPVPAARVPAMAIRETAHQAAAMARGVAHLITHPEAWSQIGGPIMMGQLTSELVQARTDPLWLVLVNLAVLLSLNLALLNLLPLPALDGGRLLFVLIEALRGGRRIAPEREGLVHLAGLAALLLLMLVLGGFDLLRIVQGQRILG